MSKVIRIRTTRSGDCRGAAQSCLVAVRVLALAFVLLAVLAPLVSAADEPAPLTTMLEVFVREGCPHCAEAKSFLGQLARERPALRIAYREVDRDQRALEELLRRSQEAGISPPGVPTFAIDGRLLVGFDDAESSGPVLLAFIDEGPSAAEPSAAALPGGLSATRLGLPLFTLALGLIDGFNPCAMWVLLFLLSLLVRLRDRRRMALVAGTFVFVSGAVYYAFMAAWLNVFLVVGMSDLLRRALAAVALLIGAINVKDALAGAGDYTLAIPAAAKPGIYTRMRAVLQAEALPASLVAVAALAVVVNFFELLCTAGLPAIYTAVLAQQQLAPAAHYAYLGLYIVGYVADDALMVATAVAVLGGRKLTERAGRWLKLASGAVMLALAAVMVLRPDWLAAV
jgi:glutaredoxin